MNPKKQIVSSQKQKRLTLNLITVNLNKILVSNTNNRCSV